MSATPRPQAGRVIERLSGIRCGGLRRRDDPHRAAPAFAGLSLGARTSDRAVAFFSGALGVERFYLGHAPLGASVELPVDCLRSLGCMGGNSTGHVAGNLVGLRAVAARSEVVWFAVTVALSFAAPMAWPGGLFKSVGGRG